MMERQEENALVSCNLNKLVRTNSSRVEISTSRLLENYAGVPMESIEWLYVNKVGSLKPDKQWFIFKMYLELVQRRISKTRTPLNLIE